MAEWLSVKEAALLVHKSEVTIRRTLNERSFDSSLNVRKNVVRKRGRMEVERDSLLQFYGLERSGERSNERSKKQDERSFEPLNERSNDSFLLSQKAIEALEKQLQVKDEQIKELHNQIQSLNERIREQNILLANFQQKFLLEAPDEKEDKKKWHPSYALKSS